YQDEAMRRLKARGTFEDGTYYDVDPESDRPRARDGVEALYDEQYFLHTGQKYVIPQAGYDAAILIHPRAFAYHQAGRGVELKPLGRFFDHPGPCGDTYIAMIRLAVGGTYLLEPERAQVVWTLGDGLQIQGRRYPAQTYVYAPRNECLELAAAA